MMGRSDCLHGMGQKSCKATISSCVRQQMTACCQAAFSAQNIGGPSDLLSDGNSCWFPTQPLGSSVSAVMCGRLFSSLFRPWVMVEQAMAVCRKFEEVEAWMRHRRLPKLTQKKIRCTHSPNWTDSLPSAPICLLG